MNVGEAYAAFKQELELGVELGKSKFFSLRPPDVFHEREIPAAVCMCQVHADMDGLLKGLSITASSALSPLQDGNSSLSRCAHGKARSSCWASVTHAKSL